MLINLVDEFPTLHTIAYDSVVTLAFGFVTLTLSDLALAMISTLFFDETL